MQMILHYDQDYEALIDIEFNQDVTDQVKLVYD